MFAENKSTFPTSTDSFYKIDFYNLLFFIVKPTNTNPER